MRYTRRTSSVTHPLSIWFTHHQPSNDLRSPLAILGRPKSTSRLRVHVLHGALRCSLSVLPGLVAIVVTSPAGLPAAMHRFGTSPSPRFPTIESSQQCAPEPHTKQDHHSRWHAYQATPLIGPRPGLFRSRPAVGPCLHLPLVPWT